MQSNTFANRTFLVVFFALAFTLGGQAALRFTTGKNRSVASTTVEVTATYPGVSSETVEKGVTTPIEEELSGAEGMVSLSSKSYNDGRMVLTATFAGRKDPDGLASKIINRLAKAEPRLPAQVLKRGIEVKIQFRDTLRVLKVGSSDKGTEGLMLTNANIIDAAESGQPHLRRVSALLPRGVRYHVATDMTHLVYSSLSEVLGEVGLTLLLIFIVLCVCSFKSNPEYVARR